MTPQELKNSILQLAIEGKLVEQRSEEGTGEELYKKIQAEKQKLIEEGKIKKEKPLPEITEDEIPFEIPENWIWMRVGNIGDWGSGATPSRSNASYYDGDIPWLKTGDLNDGYISEVPESITELALENTSVKLNPVGSVLMAMYGATIGKLGILKVPMTTNQACCACIPFVGIYNVYLFYYLMARRMHFIKMAEGGAQPNISKEKIVTALFPLPPLAEQKRIVAKIEELLPLVDRYEKAWTRLEDFNRRFPIDMQKSIFQLAIEGKLVPQRPEEGTGEALYEEIQAEKQKLIKAGKLKKEKPLPDISPDEIPFEIPESWKWVHIADVIELLSGTDLKPSQYNSVNKGIPYITGASNIDNSQIIINRWTSEPKRIAHKGDLLLTCKGTIGKTAILQEDSVHIARQLMSLQNTRFLDMKYLKYFIDYIAESLRSQGQGVIPGIDRSLILLHYFPLPPLAEQKRIVAKIEELLPLCERLK